MENLTQFHLLDRTLSQNIYNPVPSIPLYFTSGRLSYRSDMGIYSSVVLQFNNKIYYIQYTCSIGTITGGDEHVYTSYAAGD